MNTRQKKALWEAVHAYVAFCGGDPPDDLNLNATRMHREALEKLVAGFERDAVNATLSEALNSGSGTYKP